MSRTCFSTKLNPLQKYLYLIWVSRTEKWVGKNKNNAKVVLTAQNKANFIHKHTKRNDFVSVSIITFFCFALYQCAHQFRIIIILINFNTKETYCLIKLAGINISYDRSVLYLLNIQMRFKFLANEIETTLSYINGEISLIASVRGRWSRRRALIFRLYISSFRASSSMAIETQSDWCLLRSVRYSIITSSPSQLAYSKAMWFSK